MRVCHPPKYGGAACRGSTVETTGCGALHCPGRVFGLLTLLLALKCKYYTKNSWGFFKDDFFSLHPKAMTYKRGWFLYRENNPSDI